MRTGGGGGGKARRKDGRFVFSPISPRANVRKCSKMLAARKEKRVKIDAKRETRFFARVIRLDKHARNDNG